MDTLAVFRQIMLLAVALTLSLLPVSYASKGACSRNPGPVAQMCSRSNVVGTTVSIDTSFFKDSKRTGCHCRLNITSPEVLVVTTAAPGFKGCGASLSLTLGGDERLFDCTMGTYTSTRGTGSISVSNTTKNIVDSNYCVLFQVRVGEVVIECDEQGTTGSTSLPGKTIFDMSTSAITDSIGSNTQTFQTNTQRTSTNTTLDEDITNIRQPIVDQTAIMMKYPEVNDTLVEPFPGSFFDLIKPLEDAILPMTTDSAAKVETGFSVSPIVPIQDGGADVAKSTFSSVTTKTTDIPVVDGTNLHIGAMETSDDMPSVNQSAILEKHANLSGLVIEPVVPENFTSVENASEIIIKTTETKINTTDSSTLDIPLIDTNIPLMEKTSIFEKYANFSGVLIEPVESENFTKIENVTDAYVTVNETTPGIAENITTGIHAVNKSAIFEKYADLSGVLFEPVDSQNATTVENVTDYVMDGTSRGVVIEGVTSDIPTINKSAVFEKYSNFSGVLIEPVDFQNATAVESVTDSDGTSQGMVIEGVTSDIPNINKSVIFEKYSNLSEVLIEPVDSKNATAFENVTGSVIDATSQGMFIEGVKSDIPTINKSAIFEKYSNLSEVLIEPVDFQNTTSFENITDFVNDGTSPSMVIEGVTSDIPTINKSAIFENYSNLSGVLIEPVDFRNTTSFENITDFVNDGTSPSMVTSDIPIINQTAIFEKYANLTGTVIEPVDVTTVENVTDPLMNGTSPGMVIEGVTSNIPIINQTAIFEKYSNLTGILIEPIAPENLTMVEEVTYPTVNGTSTEILENVSSDISAVNKSSIIEKYTNLSGLLVEPVASENYTLYENITTLSHDNLTSEMHDVKFDQSTNSSLVNKSAIFEKYGNLSGILIEPVGSENVTENATKQEITPILPESGVTLFQTTIAYEKPPEESGITRFQTTVANEKPPEEAGTILFQTTVAHEKPRQEPDITRFQTTVAYEKPLEESGVTRFQTTVANEKPSEESGTIFFQTTIAHEKPRQEPDITHFQTTVANEKLPEESGIARFQTTVANEKPSEESGKVFFQTTIEYEKPQEVSHQTTGQQTTEKYILPVLLSTTGQPDTSQHTLDIFGTTEKSVSETFNQKSDATTIQTAVDNGSVNKSGLVSESLVIDNQTQSSVLSTTNDASTQTISPEIKSTPVGSLGIKTVQTNGLSATTTQLDTVTEFGVISTLKPVQDMSTTISSGVGVSSTKVQDATDAGENISAQSTNENAKQTTDTGLKEIAEEIITAKVDIPIMAEITTHLGITPITMEITTSDKPIKTGVSTNKPITTEVRADKEIPVQITTESLSTADNTTDKPITVEVTANTAESTTENNSTVIATATPGNDSHDVKNVTRTEDRLESFYINNHTLTIIIIGSVVGVLVIIAIIVIITSFMKSRRRSADITSFEKGDIELNGGSGGIDNPLVQLEQERQLVETNPNPALNGSMDFKVLPATSGDTSEQISTEQQTTPVYNNTKVNSDS